MAGQDWQRRWQTSDATSAAVGDCAEFRRALLLVEWRIKCLESVFWNHPMRRRSSTHLVIPRSKQSDVGQAVRPWECGACRRAVVEAVAASALPVADRELPELVASWVLTRGDGHLPPSTTPWPREVHS
jgi:hypothetical protein